MRLYFKEYGWPSSTIFETPPEGDEERAKLIDTLQDWKTERYKEIIKSGTVEPRPGVLRLMDEAKAAGKKLAVCSAATKSSVLLCLENLIGMERFQGLDCFLAGMLSTSNTSVLVVRCVLDLCESKHVLTSFTSQCRLHNMMNVVHPC
ncbi:hypothetical protein REPUB_Repub10bG0106600 [Reevesia pubescens]